MFLNSVMPRTAFHRASVGTALLILMFFRGILWQALICDPPGPGNCAEPAGDAGGEQSSTTVLLLRGTSLTNGSCAQPLSLLWWGFALHHCMQPTSVITQIRWERIGFSMDGDEVFPRSFENGSTALNQKEQCVHAKQSCVPQKKCKILRWIESATERCIEEAGDKGWRIGYGEGEERCHVSTEYGTIGSQPWLDECVCAVIVSVLHRRTMETVSTLYGC